MLITQTIQEVRAALAPIRLAGKRIGFMPTLGYMHEGHLKNIDLAKQHAEVVVVSIFVNPTQFGPTEDFSGYPRNFERDRELCESRGTDLIFAPSVSEMYSERALITLNIAKMAEHLCGAKRPGHFNGVAQVVAKFFNIIQPDIAVFGQKDVQQLFILKRMVADLNFSTKIIGAPTVREPDGLAMSSRNMYLTPAQRSQSSILYQSLLLGKKRVLAGERSAKEIIAEITQLIQTASEARIDYVEIVRASDLQPIDVLDSQSVIALAVYFGKARLIDNIILEIKGNSVSEIGVLV